MNTLAWLVDDSFSTRLTVALLHLLWQGCCIGLLVMTLGSLLSGASARLRYSLNVASLLGMAACLPVTFLLVSGPAEVTTRPPVSQLAHVAASMPSTGIESPAQPLEPGLSIVSEVMRADEPGVAGKPASEMVAVAPNNESSQPTNWVHVLSSLLTTDALSALSRWIAPLYLIGVVCILGRLVLGVWGGHRLRSLAILIEDEALLVSFRKLALRVGLQAAPTVAWCEQISVPVVVGIVRPMILLPLAVVSNLTPDQVQALMLHELSHIRRYDPIVNLLQRIVEALLFFHPVVWFVSRRISIERELAADDMVLAAGWDRPLYADALVRMAELAIAVSGRSAVKNAAVLAATGTNPSEFNLRILRLLEVSRPREFAFSRSGVLLALALVLVGGAFWSQAQPPAGKGEPVAAAADPDPPKDIEPRKEKEGEEASRLLAAVANKLDPNNSVLTTIDNGPVNQCRAVIKQLDDSGDRKLASMGRERLARRWKRISEQPPLSFVRAAPVKDPARKGEKSGETVGVQTELDGVWSEGKGTADNWIDWIRRKQDDYRTERLQLLFAAGQGYRKADDAASAERVLVAGLSGHEIYDADLKSLLGKYWPVASDEPAKSLGPGPHAWTLVNYLGELSAVQQVLGKTEQAINTHSRLTLAHFMLSWQQPSAGPTKHATELWSLIRKRPESLPPLFWFNLVDKKNPQQKFDLAGAGQKGKPLTYHHHNVAAAAALEFEELTITARTHGREGFLDCYRMNAEGKHETIGLLQPSTTGETDQTVTKKLEVPRGTSLVQFMVGGDGFQVGEVTVDVKFVKQAGGAGAANEPARDAAAPGGVKTRRKPALLFPDRWIVLSVGFEKDEQELVTVSTQSVVTIRRWDLVGKKLISEIKLEGDKGGRSFRQETVLLSGDRRRVVAATDAYVGIWETATGKLLTKLPIPKVGDNDTVRRLSCTPDLSLVVGTLETNYSRTTLVYDAHTVVWDGATGKLLRTNTHHQQNVFTAISLSADGKRLATTNGGGAVIWDPHTGEQLLTVANDNSLRKDSDPKALNIYSDHVWSVQLSPSGKQLAVGDTLGVKLLDATSGKLLQVLAGPYSYSSGPNPNLVFSPDGQWLARLGTGDKVAGARTGYVVPIWSTQTGQKRVELQTNANVGDFTSDGQHFALGFSDLQQALSIWPLDDKAIDPEQPAGPGPESRQDKVEENGHYWGKKAAEFIDKFKPTWGDVKLGIQYGIALTKPQLQYRSGERVSLVVFFRNASDGPLTIDMRPDFFGNTPKVIDSKGVAVEFENVPLLGEIAHYVEPLQPGEAVGPFYLSFGLGENPRPGKQHWHPDYKAPVAGKYQLTHTVALQLKDRDQAKDAEVTTGGLAFEIVDGGKPADQRPKDNSGAAPLKEKPNYVKVIGQLLDADTGKPIEKASWECGMASLEKPREVAWGHSRTMGGSYPDGQFEQLVHFTPDGRFDRLRVYAAGYETTVVVNDLPSPRPLQVERIVRLKRGQTITGTLRDHTGKPVANGWVFFIPAGHSSNIVEGVPGTDAYNLPDKPRDGAVAEARTNTQGQFVLSAGSAGTLAASTDAVDLWPFPLPDDGRADLKLPGPAHLVIDLTYWYLDDLAKKDKRAVSPNSEDPNHCWIQVDRSGDGKGLWKNLEYHRQMFVFALEPREKLSKGVSVGPVMEGEWDKPIPGVGHNKNTATKIHIALPPGSYRVQRLKAGPFAPVDEQNVELKPGADTVLHWSRGDGAAVRGKVAWPANMLFVRQEGAVPRKLDWTVPDMATVTIANAEGKPIEAAKVQVDGRFFVATHLEPGKYKATATVYLPEHDFRGGYRGPDCVATQEFVIAEPLRGPSGSPPANVELAMDANGPRFVPAPKKPTDP